MARRKRGDEELELLASEPLPDNPAERLETLRDLAGAENYVPDHCPECGLPLDGIDVRGHAELHWPAATPDVYMGEEARQRKAALLRYAQRHPYIQEG